MIKQVLLVDDEEHILRLLDYHAKNSYTKWVNYPSAC